MQTVLVIDPDPHYREYLGLVLERAGYAVRALADAAGLAAALAAGPVAAALADIDAPGIVAGLRSAAPGLPVIGMSGDNPDPGAATRLGVEAVLGKPSRSSDIIAALLRALPVTRP